MKKILAVIATLVVTATSAFAQQEPGTFCVRPEVGIVASNITNADAKYREGFTAGLEADWQMSHLCNLSLGVTYSQQGSKISDGAGAINGLNFVSNQKLSLQYINVPIMFNVYPFEGVGLAFKAGVQPGFLVGRSAYTTLNGEELPEDFKTDYFNKFNLCIPVGVSYEFDMGIILDLRYNIGVTNIWEHSNLLKADESASRNMSVQLTLGYKIPLN